MYIEKNLVKRTYCSLKKNVQADFVSIELEFLMNQALEIRETYDL